MIDNSEQATNEVMRSDLPTQQKLQLIDRLKKIGNNKEEFDKFKEQMQNSVMSAKERLTAQQRTLKMQQDHEIKVEGLKQKDWMNRQTVALREKGLEIQAAKLEEQQRHNEAVEDIRAEETITGVQNATNKEIATISKDKNIDEETKAKRIKAAKRAAERRMEEIKGRKGGKGEGPDKSKEAKDIPPDYAEWLVTHDTPENRASFDKKYGKGAANEIIERSKQKG